jgi:hypothetical protein
MNSTDYSQTAMRNVTRQTVVFLALLLLSLKPVSAAVENSPAANSVQNKIAIVGILSFQDETDSGAPPELGRKIAQLLKQRLASSFKDIVPRSLSSDAGATVSVEQALAIGRQNAVQFVVRGGLLVLTSPGQANVNARLYAEIISVESGAVTVVNAEGAGTGSGAAMGAIQWSTIDLNSASFASSAPGAALAAAIESLANSLHEAITGPAASGEAAPSNTTGTANPVDTAAAETEDELRQLIAQAEEVVASDSGDADRLKPLSSALQKLKSALVSKASLVESGGDSTQSDQEIAAAKNELQSALTVVTEQAASTSANSEEATPTTGEKKSLLSAIDQRAGEALGLLQKIQEIRAALKGGASASEDSEQGTGDVSGVVMQEGQPLAGVEVTDQVSGLTAMTRQDGSYTLKGLAAGKLSNLVLKKNGKQLAKGQIVPGRVADFELKPSKGTGGSAQRIVPSAIVLKANPKGAATGTVNGKAKDQTSKPISLALVSIGEGGTKEPMAVARTDSQGRYSFSKVPAGDYLLTIQKHGFRPTTARVSVKPNGASEVQSQLRTDPQTMAGARKGTMVSSSAGSTSNVGGAKPVTVSGARTINQASPPRDSAATAGNPARSAQISGALKGKVVDAANRTPISGATVSIAGRRVKTDQGGNFDLADLTPGSYVIKVMSAGFSEDQESITIRSGATTRDEFALKRLGDSNRIVRGVPEAPRATTPTRLGRVRGRVVDAASGVPIAGAVVAVSGQQRTVTGRDGSYTLNGLPPGSYQVSISKVGFAEKRTAFNVRAGEVTNADFRLTGMIRRPSR